MCDLIVGYASVRDQTSEMTNNFNKVGTCMKDKRLERKYLRARPAGADSVHKAFKFILGYHVTGSQVVKVKVFM